MKLNSILLQTTALCSIIALNACRGAIQQEASQTPSPIPAASAPAPSTAQPPQPPTNVAQKIRTETS